MQKNTNQKNKKVLSLIWLTSFFAVAFIVIHVTYPYIGIYLILNTFHSSSSSYNNKSMFYGENIDMSQILPTSQHYVVNSKGKDLIDIAADLGVNIIRITNGERSFNNNGDSIYTKSQWDQVFYKMQNNGIKAIIVIETASSNKDNYAPDIRPVYLHLVQEYIESKVFSNSDIYAVDIKNEPLLTDANVGMLQVAHSMIKKMYPNLKQTVGWWATAKQPEDPYNPNNYNWSDFSAGQKIANIVDFYSIHMYGLDADNFGINLSPDLKTKLFLSRVENGLHTTKPILIEEFGEANGDAVSDQDTIGSQQLQASVYHGVYQALKEMHSNQLIGSVAFDFYSRNQYPDAWAIVKNHGNYLFPAAYILQEYALGKNNSSLQTTTVVTAQSYLFENADNYTSKILHIYDRVGLKLQLDHNQNYSVSFSTHGILHPIELFYYDPEADSYYAVYQAVNKGNTQLSIISHANNITDPNAAFKVYSLTITVQ